MKLVHLGRAKTVPLSTVPFRPMQSFDGEYTAGELRRAPGRLHSDRASPTGSRSARHFVTPGRTTERAQSAYFMRGSLSNATSKNTLKNGAKWCTALHARPLLTGPERHHDHGRRRVYGRRSVRAGCLRRSRWRRHARRCGCDWRGPGCRRTR